MDDVRTLMALYLDRYATTKLYRYKPYQWQAEVHNNASPERLLMAANGVGKTMPGAAETAFHLTGLYPDWWTGPRFDEPILAWAGTIDNDFQRDNNQFALLGKIGENEGTGWLPKTAIKKIAMRQAGISSVADEVLVHHVSGGTSSLRFRTYEQGWRKWQGAPPRFLWLDEQQDENAVNEADIYVEAQTRTVRNSGRILVTLTPLLGETKMIRHFVEGAAGTWWRGATWDDAPHLKEADKSRLRAAYPAHQLRARTMGVPMLGEGQVFNVAEENFRCEPFKIPDHFRIICGIDFGINKDHPQAAVWCAYDADGDVFYVTDSYRLSDQTTTYHAAALKRRGSWIPVAWPHDGVNREKGSGEPMFMAYRNEGVNMLPFSARYSDEKGGGQETEPVVIDLLDRMRTDRFKVFSTQSEWFDECRSFHRKQGRIIAIRDDLLKASFYAYMMRRFAAPKPSFEDGRRARISTPIVSMGWN